MLALDAHPMRGIGAAFGAELRRRDLVLRALLGLVRGLRDGLGLPDLELDRVALAGQVGESAGPGAAIEFMGVVQREGGMHRRP